MSLPRCTRLLPSAFATLALLASTASGQVRQQTLTEPDATFPDPFTSIVGLRELSDGQLLLADRTERHVSFIDFASGRIDQVGRQGGGPGEYEMPTGLFAWPDDGALLVDLANTRVTRITAGGRLDKSWPILSSTGVFLNPSATDGEGRVYYSSAGSFRAGPGAPPPSDSMPVVRWDPATDVHDTVAMLYSQPRITTSGGGGGGFTVRTGAGGAMRLSGLRRQPFRAVDAWGVSLGGDVAVVRATDYRVDWYRGTNVTSGPSIDYEPIRINQAEQEAWADGQAGQTMTMMVLGGSGGGGRTMQTPRPDLDEVDFPDVKPPFQSTGTRVTPDGEVWVRRHQRHDAERPLYDVFDAGGELIKQVRLPAGRTIVGFGRGVVYAVSVDEDDLQWLERYAR
ncbi:MAG: hypothetical protein O7I93_02530 [Gemmatimonadetes bacterium]|nr:hypothetical protein [Gemmatimonadota bacterium]